MSPLTDQEVSMRVPRHGRTVLTIAAAIAALQWSLTAQIPGAVKRPLTYDVVDSWKSIQCTRLSDDGQWLAYATTAQGDDGELVVRNLRTGGEFRHPRGTAPQFTPDAKFVVFTIAQPKAEEEKESQAAAAAGAEPCETPPAQGRGRGSARSEPRTGAGIMTLPDGHVKTFEKVGSFRVPEKSSTWLAYYKGLGGAGGGGGRGGRGGGGARGAQSARGAGSAQSPDGSAHEKRKDQGADLVIRNLVSGDEITIPEVSEYEWDTRGDWIAYAVSSNDAAKDGAFARHIADGSVK